MSRAYVALARRPLAAALAVALVALVFAIVGTIAADFPPARIHDELSYLLSAETFASGRLTNPTHPMWRFFETFHVLQQPTYTSKYPPANALFIALGWVSTGSPIVGVWLSVVFMCVCVHWMLRAWVSDRLGLGITLAAIVMTSGSYWSTSYWGGAVAAGAGALTLGALHRVVTGRGHPSVMAALLGLGLVLLANSRPYEGLLLAIPVAILFLRWLFTRHSVQALVTRTATVVLPLAVVGVLGLGAMLLYNQRVTGSPTRMPYSAYSDERDPTPIFLWQAPKVIVMPSDSTMLRFIANAEELRHEALSSIGPLKRARAFATDFADAFIPAVLCAPLLLLWFARRNRWVVFGALTIVVVGLGMSLATYYLSHYMAPVVALVLALYGISLRWLSRARVGKVRAGQWLAVAIITTWMGLGVARLGSVVHRAKSDPPDVWARRRVDMIDELSQRGRPDLVLVRYGPRHRPGLEWVYNSANIDASPVVWARDRGEVENRQLLAYFADRDPWLLEVDEDKPPFVLRPYPAPGGAVR